MTDVREGGPPAAALDIQALLRVALEQGPKDDVQERVMTRVAAATTVMEFARLLFVAPVQWIFDAPREEADDDIAE